MRTKSAQEQNAVARQVELLSNALSGAEKGNGYWLNVAGRETPRIYSDRNSGGIPVSPFNSLILSLHSAENGFKTPFYITFADAKKRGDSILTKQRGVPFNWYIWDKYVNRNNPSDTITRDRYKELTDEEKRQYKGVQRRQILTMFNLEQSAFPHNHKELFGKIVTEHGRYEDRLHEKTEEKELKGRVKDFIEKISANLVPIRHYPDSSGRYDSKKDTVSLPNQKNFHNYQDYVQEMLRQVVSATGHQQRLAREGMVMHGGKAPSEDALRHEQLVVEVASAIKMQELGLPARLSPESYPMVEYWVQELNDNPCMIDALETDVNAALGVIRKAEQGEKIEYATLRNSRETEEARAKNRPSVDSREAAILTDIIAHGGMVIADGNFFSQEEKDAFLVKFGLKNFEKDKVSALAMTHDDDPEVVENAYTQMQVDAAQIAERCSGYLPYEWREDGHFFISSELAKLSDKQTREMVVVWDENTAIADVILPGTAMSGGMVTLPNGDRRPYYVTPDEVMSEEERNTLGVKVKPNTLTGFSKAKIEAAIKAESQDARTYVRFFNRDGALGYRPDDMYFKDKTVRVMKLNGNKLDIQAKIDVTEAVNMATAKVFDAVQLLRDDDGRWTMYIKPQGEPGYGVYPDKEDINRLFSTIKQGQSEESVRLRMELAEKYHAIVQNKPELKVDIFGEKASEEDAARITHVSIFRTKDDKLMILPTIEGEEKKPYPREITQSQWERLWMAEDMAQYKINLAAHLFQDVLHKELHENQAIEQSEKTREEQERLKEEIREEAEKKKQEEEKKKEQKNSEPFKLLQSFLEMKAKHDALLLFRTDDSYVCYKEDAEKVAGCLGLEKTQKENPETGEQIDMCEFKLNQLDTYLPKIVRAGNRVAICDELTRPESLNRGAAQGTDKEEAKASLDAEAKNEKEKAEPEIEFKEEEEEGVSRGFHR